MTEDDVGEANDDGDDQNHKGKHWCWSNKTFTFKKKKEIKRKESGEKYHIRDMTIIFYISTGSQPCFPLGHNTVQEQVHHLAAYSLELSLHPECA